MAPARGKRSAAGDAPSPLTGGNDLSSSREVDVEIVVPCYNEAARLRVADFVAFARDPEMRADNVALARCVDMMSRSVSMMGPVSNKHANGHGHNQRGT